MNSSALRGLSGSTESIEIPVLRAFNKWNLFRSSNASSPSHESSEAHASSASSASSQSESESEEELESRKSRKEINGDCDKQPETSKVVLDEDLETIHYQIQRRHQHQRHLDLVRDRRNNRLFAPY